jgi:cytochrome c553
MTPVLLRQALFVLCLTQTVLADGPKKPSPPAQPPASPPFAQALDGPLRDVPEIVFCARLPYDDPHWYANIGYYCDDANHVAFTGNGQPDVGDLMAWNPRTKTVRPILHDPGGSIRDPQIHYDGNRILFAWRKNGTRTYNLYEIGLDGQNLRQITQSDTYDDFEPTYLPDDRIAFVSTRSRRWVNCWYTQVATIYRCDADGSDIQPISANTEQDNTPWVLPDGRIAYMRWEYVDRSQVEFHALWAKNPDGTGEQVLFGNLHSGVVMIDAKPVPGTDDVVMSYSPGHGVNEHDGIASVVSMKAGPDAKSSVRALHRPPHTRDPIAVSAQCFLAARGKSIVYLDGQGGLETVFTLDGPGNLHEPRPVMKRPRERIIPDRTSPNQSTGRFVLSSASTGRNLPGVAPGEVKKLLVLESLPKPVNFSGGMDLTSWLGTFTLERVLGTVPVEPDGSAYFEAPAGRQLFFVSLDAHDRSIKRMQSWTSVMPGEVQSCVGCHEERQQTPDLGTASSLVATGREPSPIEPFSGHPDVMDFHRDVQPVLDRYCVSCHGNERREGRISLADGLGPTWSNPYFRLLATREVADGRNGLGNQPPRSIGSSASPLLAKLEGGHHDVKATPDDWRTVWLWIESGAPYAGSYAGLRNTAQQERDGKTNGMAWSRVQKVLITRCAACHDVKGGNGLKLMPKGDEAAHWAALDRPAEAHRPVGHHERIVFEHDPLARFGTQQLLDFARPEHSSVLLAPLSKSAGGWGACAGESDVFQTTDDPAYQAILDALRAAIAAAPAGNDPRWSTPGFRPNPQYVREMKRYGVLPPEFNRDSDTIDVFAIDQRYWRSLWSFGQPAPPNPVPLASGSD